MPGHWLLTSWYHLGSTQSQQTVGGERVMSRNIMNCIKKGTKVVQGDLDPDDRAYMIRRAGWRAGHVTYPLLNPHSSFSPSAAILIAQLRWGKIFISCRIATTSACRVVMACRSLVCFCSCRSYRQYMHKRWCKYWPFTLMLMLLDGLAELTEETQ